LPFVCLGADTHDKVNYSENRCVGRDRRSDRR